MAPVCEAVIPDFLNDYEFKKSIVKDLDQNEIKVIDTKITLASKPGDNYTSTIYSAAVTYQEDYSKTTKTANFIIKSILTQPGTEMIENLGVIEKEINVYVELLPKLSETAGNIQFSPKCFDIFRKPSKNFIFQDMRASGYKIGDREIGLDENHIRLVLNKIAKFHAASMELLRKQPNIEEKFSEGFFTELSVQEPIFLGFYTGNIGHGAEIVSNLPGYERFADKLRKIKENFPDFALKAVKFDAKTDLKVFNHGDLWVNNFLFKYDEETNKPTDIVYVDYQGSFFGSPGIDINYLFATSATLDVMKRKWQLIEESYYPTFVNALKEFKIPKIPSLDDIRREIRNREMYTIITLFGVLPVISMNREESKTNSFDQFLDEEKLKKKRFVGMASKRFRESMKYTLNELESLIDEAISKY